MPAMGASAVQLARAWNQAQRAMAAVPMALSPGYTLFWTRGGEVDMRRLTTAPGDYAIVGRHRNCDALLPHDPTISLRHLLARAVELEDGTPALRLLDLQTQVPLVLEDGSCRQSIVASGPLLLRLGDYVLGAVPNDPKELEAASGGPYRRPPPPVVHHARRLPTESGRRAGRASCITVLPRPPSLAELPSGLLDPSQQRITVSRGYEAVTVALDAEALSAGVLVGRASKCCDSGGLRTLMGAGISRAHLLLLQDGDSTYAFDLCSTQGTYAADRRVRQTRLSSYGSMITLARRESVDLWWHPRQA